MYKALTSLSGGVVPGDFVDTSKMDAQNIARLVSIRAIERVGGDTADDNAQAASAPAVDVDDLSHLDDDSDESPAVGGVEKRQRGRPRINP